MDNGHGQLLAVAAIGDRAVLSFGVEPAIDITLAGRYYERFADHAVSVARRVVYLVTGERSHPL